MTNLFITMSLNVDSSYDMFGSVVGIMDAYSKSVIWACFAYSVQSDGAHSSMCSREGDINLQHDRHNYSNTIWRPQGVQTSLEN